MKSEQNKHSAIRYFCIVLFHLGGKQTLVLYCFLCCLCSSTLFAQVSRIDSLTNVVMERENLGKFDTITVQLLQTLANLHINSNIRQAQKHSLRALEISEQIQYSVGQMRGYMVLSRIATNLGDFAKVHEYLEKALTLNKKMGKITGLVDIWNNYGRLYQVQNQYQKALEAYYKALAFSNELPLFAGTTRVFMGLTLVHRLRGEYAKALEYAYKGLKAADSLNDKENSARLYGDISYIYSDQGRYNEALEAGLKCIEGLQRLSQPSQYKIPIAIRSLGVSFVYQELKQYDKALEYCLKALPVLQEVRAIDHEITAHTRMAKNYSLQKNYDKASISAKEALRLSTENKDTEGIARALVVQSLISSDLQKHQEAINLAERAFSTANPIANSALSLEILSVMSLVNARAGNFEKALEYYTLYSTRKDSVFTRETVQKGEELKIQYETEKREKEILLLQKDKELQKLTLAEQQAEIARRRAETVQQQQRVALLQNEKSIQGLMLNQQEAIIAQTRLLLERDKQALDLAKKDRLLAEIELKRRLTLQWAFGVGLVLVTVAALWFAALYRKNKRANTLILRQQAIVEEQTAEIEIINSALQKRNQELENLNMEKNEIIGMVAHDLKNPIGAVRGLSELIHSGFADENQISEITGQIVITADRMLELVKNLLDVNQLESGGMQFQRVTFDIMPVLESIVQQYHIQAETKKITFQCISEAASTLILADEQATVQVLDNIISNAVKYSPHNKQVFVRVVSNSTSVRVEVQDEGQGISPDDMKKLFGKFARLSARPTGGEHSTGLGLSIVKKMVEAMNGRVWCESEVGQGATFIVELPAVSS
jgi:signal transduction histidine kinase